MLLPLASGCKGDTKSPDSAIDDTGTAPSLGQCAEDLEVGRCGLAGSLDLCAGNAGEEHVFVPVAEGDPVGIITGFQGARMFALAARTTGIDPGNPTSAPSESDPLVDAAVYASEVSVVGRYRTWMGFSDAPDEPGSVEVLELFIQLESANPVDVGQALTAQVLVTDAAGVERCGSVGFIAQ